MGYGSFGKEGSLNDIAKIVGVGPTVVSGNNGFLIGVGIVEGGNKKKITPLGRQLANAIDHNLEQETGDLWRKIAEDNEFLQSLVASVRIRRGMDDGALRSHVAYSAGLSKTGAVRTGSGTVIEILKRAGLLREEDGKLVAASQSMASESSPGQVEPVTTKREVGTTEHVSEVVSGSFPGVHLSIQVRVNCTPDELDGLGARLKDVVKELSSTISEVRDKEEEAD